MILRSRLFVWISAVVIGGALASLTVFYLLVFGKDVPSNIAGFRPSSLHAEGDEKFFYSVGDKLMYSSRIDPAGPALARCHIDNYLVAPNRKMIAIVSNRMLIVVGNNFQIRRVVPVDSIYREPKPIGRTFFRDGEYQWTRNSKSLYLIKDQFYDSKGSQLYSSKAELCRYDVDTGKLFPVLKPFPAYSYFLGRNSAVYFSVPTDEGALRLRCFDGNTIRDVGAVNAWAIPIQDLAAGFLESPFFSFSHVEFSQLYWRGANLAIDKNGQTERLVIGDKAFLVLTKGENFKGSFYCSDLYHSTFLPGRRYFLFNVPYCGNYEGQLLIDTVTGQYESLPTDSQVFLTFNTDMFKAYRVTSGGILAN